MCHSFNFERKDIGKLSFDSLGPEIWTFSVTEIKVLSNILRYFSVLFYNWATTSFFRLEYLFFQKRINPKTVKLVEKTRSSGHLGELIKMRTFILSAPEHYGTNRGNMFTKADNALLNICTVWIGLIREGHKSYCKLDTYTPVLHGTIFVEQKTDAREEHLQVLRRSGSPIQNGHLMNPSSRAAVI